MSYKIAVNGDYLAHHGVKGMHWGVWNDETKRKYGLLKTAAGGGVGGDDDEEDTEKKSVGYTSGNFHQDVDNMFDWLVQKGAEGVKDALNQHLDDIQSGNIDREEARIIGIVNAAAAGISGSGKGVISNPKAEEMGVTYGQKSDEYKHIK